MVFILLNFQIYWLYYEAYAPEKTDEDLTYGVKLTRYSMVAGTLIVVTRFSYFFQIIDSISPLYDIIIKIVKDIGWFMIIFLL